MGADYAAGRGKKPYMRYRYRVRAAVAVDAFHERQPKRDEYRVLDLGAADGRTLLYMRGLLGDMGRFDGRFQLTVATHGAELVKIGPEK